MFLNTCSNSTTTALISTMNTLNRINNSSIKMKNQYKSKNNNTYTKEINTDIKNKKSFNVISIDEKNLYEEAKGSKVILRLLSEFEEYIKDDFQNMLDDYVKNKFEEFMKKEYGLEFEFQKYFKLKNNKFSRW